MSPGNPLYNELDRLNAELEKSRTMQAILFILWAEANSRFNRAWIDAGFKSRDEILNEQNNKSS